jgi:flagellin
MPLTINTNITSLNVQRNLNSSQTNLYTSLQRLSSGLRINSAKDDAAGLAVSERMTAQIQGMNQAKRNANDGVSLSQTADAALSTSGDILIRIRELAVQASNGTNSASDRQTLNTEVQSLTQELQRIASTTEYNGKKLIDGSLASLLFQVGANAHQTISLTSSNLQTYAYGNNRIGGLAAYTNGGMGDLLEGTKGGSGTALGDAVLLSGGQGDSSAVNGATNNNDFLISTSSGSYNVFYRVGASAEEIAAAVNHFDTGVKASAVTDVVLGDSYGAAATGSNFTQNSSYTFRIGTDTASSTGEAPAASTITAINFTTGTNGEPQPGTTPVNSSEQLIGAVQAFNDVAGKTGFTAEAVYTDNKDWAIKLSSQAGKDLRINNNSDSTVSVSDISVLDGDPNTGSLNSATSLSTDTGTTWTAGSGYWFTGRVIFDSNKAFSITTAVNDVFGANGAGAAGTYGSQPQQTATLDVSTYDSAQRSLATVDAALTAITDQRARFGAFQARFESAISNLSASSDSLTTARSHIR